MSDTPTPAETAAPAPAAAPTTDSDLFDQVPEDQAVFDRGWVDKLRNEGRRYREEARGAGEALAQYEDVFGVYDDADRGVWLDLARTWVSDPNQAATVMRQIADAVLGGPTPAPGGEPADGDDMPDDTETEQRNWLTREEVESMIRDNMTAYDQQVAEDAAVEEIFAEIRELGFDPNTRDGFMVLWTANNETDGDIAKAVEVINADRQKIIDDYVGGRGTRTPVAPSGGVVAQQEQPIHNLEDARKATEAFLRNQRRDAG